MRLRKGSKLAANPDNLRASALQRFCGLCCWHGLSPSEPFSELRKALDASPIDLYPQQIQTNYRRSGRQVRDMHVSGWHGNAVIQIQNIKGLAMYSTALANGIGSSTAMGYGSWDIAAPTGD